MQRRHKRRTPESAEAPTKSAEYRIDLTHSDVPASGPMTRGTAPDEASGRRALDEVVHTLGGRILAFEFEQERAADATTLERAVLRCARDLRDLLVRASADAQSLRSPAVRRLDEELARGLGSAFAWIVERLDGFVDRSAPESQRAPTRHAWFNVPRAIDDELIALIDLCGVAAAEGARTEALAVTLRRLRGAMHRLSLLTTTVV
jgi:hypothetical protein